MARGTKTSISELARAYPDAQLATLTESPPDGPGWVHEVKFDGYRLMGFLADGDVALRTRNGKDWTARFPAIAEGMRSFGVTDAVVDMEAVVLDEAGRSSFKGLQQALSGGGEGIAAFAFDLLHLKGVSCAGLPLLQRKEKLKSLLARSESAIRFSSHSSASGPELLGEACSQGLEGIVSKQVGAPYAGGRHRSWMKTKCVRRQEFLILGYSAPRSGTRALGALYLGYKRDGRLRYAGKCGTGFSMEGARSLAVRLRTAKAPPIGREGMAELGAAEWRAVHWVEPATVCEVAFTEWTREGRIRHPSFQGVREDKPAKEVVKEEP